MTGALSTGRTTAPTAAPGDVPAVVAAVVAAVLGEPAPSPDLALDGCDSIDLVEIAERVEARLRPTHPAVAIDDAALARCTHVGELARLVASSLGGPHAGAASAGSTSMPA